MMTDFDWALHQHGKPVLCIINIRPAYKGRAVKRGLQALNGKRVPLTPYWFIEPGEEGSGYGGEWALGPADRSGVHGPKIGSSIPWIASGDVDVIEPQPALNAVADSLDPK